jgi:hypothetical protein
MEEVMIRKVSIVCVFSLGIVLAAAPGLTVDWVDPKEYIVAGVIGASYEGAQAPETFTVAPNSWYMSGHYKTWVDLIAGLPGSRDEHWLNYAWAGDVSVNGTSYLEDMLNQTLVLDENGQPVTTVSVLVIGFWGNDFVWLPGYDQDVMDALIANVGEQIEMARQAGVEKIIVTGWPEYDQIDLDYFITLFPELTTHIDESGYNQAKQLYEDSFGQPNSDYLFVDLWCTLKTFDGIHPAEETSRRAAFKIGMALRHYNRLIGRTNLFCR